MRSHAETAKLLVILAITALSLQSRAQTAPPPDTIAGVEKQSTAPSAQAASSGSQVSSDEVRKEEGPKKRKWRVRLGGTAVYAGYAHFPSNFYYPFFPYGFGYTPFAGYAPLFYDPFYWSSYGPYGLYGPSLVYAPDKGQVELNVDQKDAEVYIDDAYAGTAGGLKHLWLEPGAYNMTVSASDGSSFHQRIYVLSGKSVKIRAKLVRQSVQDASQERQQ